jgi:hypothetical protein
MELEVTRISQRHTTSQAIQLSSAIIYVRKLYYLLLCQTVIAFPANLKSFFNFFLAIWALFHFSNWYLGWINLNYCNRHRSHRYLKFLAESYFIVICKSVYPPLNKISHNHKQIRGQIIRRLSLSAKTEDIYFLKFQLNIPCWRVFLLDVDSKLQGP